MMKKWFQKLLESIKVANRDNFAEERLDCCQLNKRTHENKTEEETK